MFVTEADKGELLLYSWSLRWSEPGAKTLTLQSMTSFSPLTHVNIKVCIHLDHENEEETNQSFRSVFRFI